MVDEQSGLRPCSLVAVALAPFLPPTLHLPHEPINRSCTRLRRLHSTAGTQDNRIGLAREGPSLPLTCSCPGSPRAHRISGSSRSPPPCRLPSFASQRPLESRIALPHPEFRPRTSHRVLSAPVAPESVQRPSHRVPSAARTRVSFISQVPSLESLL